MWLKIAFDEETLVNWSVDPTNFKVDIINSSTAPVSKDDNTIRLSPIFPLLEEVTEVDLQDTNIFFYNFSNAYKILGRISAAGTSALQQSVFFSLGLSSIILITRDSKLMHEFKEIVQSKENAYEVWPVQNKNIVKKIEYVNHVNSDTGSLKYDFNFVNYNSLQLSDRATVDEFIITIHLFMGKLISHMPSEKTKIMRLIEEVNNLVSDLVFLVAPNTNLPKSLSEYTFEQLCNPYTNHVIRNQNLDRIIQINSSLSYISTQAFSGAIPILERRSLIRRNSLLGIGSGILALNNIARFIESAFSKVDFERLILEHMSTASPLGGLETIANYDCSDWRKRSVNTYTQYETETSYYKLPYFSGRLGFRETEYSIAAAIQSLYAGASLEWSLMTLTHEMLHGHVRNILTTLFYKGNDANPDSLRSEFYEIFINSLKKKSQDLYLDDSIRNLIFMYCNLSFTHGSLTRKHIEGDTKTYDLPEGQLYSIFEFEFRNISEIFVHILDLHYFYAGRVSLYVPMIWCSWISVPHINGDVRQYVLRTLLSISSKERGNVYERLHKSAYRLREILLSYKSDKLNYPIIPKIIAILDDHENLEKEYLYPFKASLIIVDLVTEVFISEKIRSGLFKDPFVKWESDEENEDSFEQEFEYNLPAGFNDENINSPLAYLLDRMTKTLNNNTFHSDLERETTLMFLALNSNS